LLVILSPTTFGYSTSRPLGFGPFGFFGAFFLIFIVILIVSMVLRIAMWSSRSGGRYGYRGGGGRRYGAYAIARERYARGEISREQYDQLMQDLQRRPGFPPPP
jgi:putative membrane protein